MLRITLAVIGRMKPSPEAELLARYQKQLGWKLTIREVEARKGLSGEALKQAEAELLLGATSECHQRIALDERGKALSSTQLAQTLEQWQLQGCSHLGICIGGADGLAASLREASSLVLFFGALTWPHMLVRAMLLEQLYRAESILRGHPYHRE